MTLRNNHKRLPPFLFTNRANTRAYNLPCDPKISTRGTTPYYYPEFRMFPGPQQIAATGDNTHDTLYGRTWAALFCANHDFLLLQWNAEAEAWDTITDPLLPIPAFTGLERSFTAAFDQSARLIFAYEHRGLIRVTRWDNDAGQYTQNVNFSGHDPALLMDATITGEVPDSDVVLFYVNPSRTDVNYRIQRETYSVEHDLKRGDETSVEYPAGVVLDYAQAIPYRFELLVAHESGTRRDLALVSDLYPIYVTDTGGAAGDFGNAVLSVTTYNDDVTNAVLPGAAFPNPTLTVQRLPLTITSPPLNSTAAFGDATLRVKTALVDSGDLPVVASAAAFSGAALRVVRVLVDSGDLPVVASGASFGGVVRVKHVA